MTQGENYLLNRLDQPLRFLGVHKDEAFVMLAPFLGGLFMGWALTGFVAGISFLTCLRALKKHNEGAALVHAIYWYLPTSKRSMRIYVPSYIREWIG